MSLKGLRPYDHTIQAIFFIQWGDSRFCGITTTNVLDYKSRHPLMREPKSKMGLVQDHFLLEASSPGLLEEAQQQATAQEQSLWK